MFLLIKVLDATEYILYTTVVNRKASHDAPHAEPFGGPAMTEKYHQRPSLSEGRAGIVAYIGHRLTESRQLKTGKSKRLSVCCGVFFFHDHHFESDFNIGNTIRAELYRHMPITPTCGPSPKL